MFWSMNSLVNRYPDPIFLLHADWQLGEECVAGAVPRRHGDPSRVLLTVDPDGYQSRPPVKTENPEE